MEPACAKALPGHVMSEKRKDRPTAIRMVLPFVFRHWQKQPWLGSGLGLAIVRGIVELNAGRVWAESTPGRGTQFHLALPRQEHAGGGG